MSMMMPPEAPPGLPDPSGWRRGDDGRASPADGPAQRRRRSQAKAGWKPCSARSEAAGLAHAAGEGAAARDRPRSEAARRRWTRSATSSRR